MNLKITTDCNVENNTRDNIDDVPSFSLELTRGDNNDDDDDGRKDNVVDNEFYI